MKAMLWLLSSSAMALAGATLLVSLPPRAPSAEPAASLPNSPTPSAPGASGQLPTPARAMDWTALESPDYRQFIANLRQAGCPEQILQDIIVADVSKLYAPTETALKAALPLSDEPELGTGEPQSPPVSVASRSRQLRQVQLEKRALLKQLLGIDTPLELLRSSGNRAYELFEPALRRLPPTKRDRVQSIQENYWQQSDALKEKFPERGEAYRQEYRRLNEQRRAQLSQVLTPIELEAYEMETSPTALQLRYRLRSTPVNENEFRDLFRIFREYEAAVGPFGARFDTRSESPERDAARARREQQVKTVLGEERFTEYTRNGDSSYRTLMRLGERYGLSRETVLQGFTLELQLREKLKQLDTNPSASWTERRAARQHLVQAHDDQLRRLLGEKPAKTYRRFSPP